MIQQIFNEFQIKKEDCHLVGF